MNTVHLSAIIEKLSEEGYRRTQKPLKILIEYNEQLCHYGYSKDYDNKGKTIDKIYGFLKRNNLNREINNNRRRF